MRTALHQSAETFTGVLVDDRDDLDRAPVSGGVELEIDRPHPVGCVRGDGVGRSGGAVAFAAASVRHPQPLFAPKALDLFVIDDPALPAGIVIGGPEPAAGMVFRILA
jgi:hypothetical protein